MKGDGSPFIVLHGTMVKTSSTIRKAVIPAAGPSTVLAVPDPPAGGSRHGVATTGRPSSVR